MYLFPMLEDTELFGIQIIGSRVYLYWLCTILKQSLYYMAEWNWSVKKSNKNKLSQKKKINCLLKVIKLLSRSFSFFLFFFSRCFCCSLLTFHGMTFITILSRVKLFGMHEIRVQLSGKLAPNSSSYSFQNFASCTLNLGKEG